MYWKRSRNKLKRRRKRERAQDSGIDKTRRLNKYPFSKAQFEDQTFSLPSNMPLIHNVSVSQRLRAKAMVMHCQSDAFMSRHRFSLHSVYFRCAFLCLFMSYSRIYIRYWTVATFSSLYLFMLCLKCIRLIVFDSSFSFKRSFLFSTNSSAMCRRWINHFLYTEHAKIFIFLLLKAIKRVTRKSTTARGVCEKEPKSELQSIFFMVCIIYLGCSEWHHWNTKTIRNV